MFNKVGIYFRKSINFGLFRLNFSKSGIGASVGVRGFRVNVGPSGSYVHGGTGGIYFKEKISKKKSSPKRTYSEVGNDSNKSEIELFYWLGIIPSVLFFCYIYYQVNGFWNVLFFLIGYIILSSIIGVWAYAIAFLVAFYKGFYNPSLRDYEIGIVIWNVLVIWIQYLINKKISGKENARPNYSEIAKGLEPIRSKYDAVNERPKADERQTVSFESNTEISSELLSTSDEMYILNLCEEFKDLSCRIDAEGKIETTNALYQDFQYNNDSFLNAIQYDLCKLYKFLDISIMEERKETSVMLLAYWMLNDEARDYSKFFNNERKVELTKKTIQDIAHSANNINRNQDKNPFVGIMILENAKSEFKLEYLRALRNFVQYFVSIDSVLERKEKLLIDILRFHDE